MGMMLRVVRSYRLRHALAVWNQSLVVKSQGLVAAHKPTPPCFPLTSLSFRTTTTTTTDTTTSTRRKGDLWDSKLKELKHFIVTNGHSRVPQSHETLGWWVHANRKEYKKFQSKTRPCWMTAKRIQLLEDAGFVWDVDQAKWMDSYEKLCTYHRQHGHCLVPREDSTLGTWVRMNRQQYQKGKLSPERIKLLNRLDFVWNLRDATWNERMAELQEFVAVNGPGVMPSLKTHAVLVDWLRYQHKVYRDKRKGKKVTLTDERIEALQRLGFLLQHK